MNYNKIRSAYETTYEFLALQGCEARKELHKIDIFLIQDFATAIKKRKNREMLAADINRDIFGALWNPRNYIPHFKNFRKDKHHG